MKKRDKKRDFHCIFLVLAIILVLVLAAIIIYSNYKRNTDADKCRSDEDCIKVQTTCCPCDMGGQELCALKKTADNFKAKDCEGKLMCAAVYKCTITNCVCRAGKCESQ